MVVAVRPIIYQSFVDDLVPKSLQSTRLWSAQSVQFSQGSGLPFSLLPFCYDPLFSGDKSQEIITNRAARADSAASFII